MKAELRKKILKDIFLTIKKNINDEQIDQVISSNDSINIINCIDFLIDKHKDIFELYVSDDYQKLINIFSKTRVKEFPKLDFYINIPLEFSKKFKLKVYRLFSDSHLFDDSETLINMIAVMGLFENDLNVQNRINEVVKMFFYQKVYGETPDLSQNPNIIKRNNTLYELDENVWQFIPDELKPYFFERITPSYYSFLKNMTGNFGRKINDFLTPFNQCGVLKKGIESVIPYKNYLMDKDDNYHPFTKSVDEYYVVDPKISLELIKETLKYFEEYELTYGPSDIKSMFKKCNPIFDKDFYEYFVKHQTDIINSRNSFSKLPFIQEKFHEIIKYYKERGNNDPDYITMIELLRAIPYDIKFGDEDFAYEARNAGVLNESYELYVNLLEQVRTRLVRALPNHKNSYIINARDGNNYTIETRVLDGTDYLNMLIGESKYTDCCQKMDDLGRECLFHASTSKNGGIFLISLVTEQGTYPLSQSWIWVNEQEIVLDNIEQTLFLKIASSKKREIYEDLIAESIKNAGRDMIINSNIELNKYIDDKMSNGDISVDKLERLKEIALRQSIKVVTLGSGYSDIIVGDYFSTPAQRKLVLPKDYDQEGYTDAKIRYVVAGSEKDITIEPSLNYVEEPIYRIQREVHDCNLSSVSTSIIKRILKIDNNNFIDNVEQFYNEYELNKNDNLLYGEDWYIIYRSENSNLQLIKYNCGVPRLDDENEMQTKEFIKNIQKIRERKLQIK